MRDAAIGRPAGVSMETIRGSGARGQKARYGQSVTRAPDADEEGASGACPKT
jgi:hypothetical protein